jgi:hypothetical protein
MRDKLCPLRNGGVSLHKLYGVMHDTCNCANKVVLIPTLQPYPSPASWPLLLTLTLSTTGGKNLNDRIARS